MYREATTLGAVVMSGLPDKPEETVATPTAGPWRGYYLLLERLSDDAWLVYWRNPAVPDERLSIGEDAGDDLLGTDEQAAAGALRVGRATRRVSRDGAAVHLTPTQFDLLVCLGERPGRVLTREHLLARVWDWPDASGTRAVDSHVKTLRRKLGAEVIRTVHGVGYALEVPRE